MDLFKKCVEYDQAKKVMEMGLYPYFHAIETKQDPEVIIEGKRTIMLGSNNYMALTSDPRTIEAGKKALDEFGTGCSGSRFLNGTLLLHLELEKKLAEFVNIEAAITFSTGFQSNLGILSCIPGFNDYILSDNQNHASIVDGNRLSFAKKLKYKHNDIDDLERLLQKIPETKGVLVVTDGVFSMEGDIAKLPEIVELKKKYGFRIMVDDAHGLGMIGKGGRGTASHFGLEKETDIIMSTFSKSLASLGGFIASNNDVIHYMKHNSRPFIFSASIPPANAAVALKALEIIESEPERVEKLQENGDYMRENFKRLGIPIGNSQTAIIPVMTYDSMRTFIITKRLLEEGVYVNPVIAPAVEEGKCLLRTSYTAKHTKDQLDFALEKFDKVFKENKM